MVPIVRKMIPAWDHATNDLASDTADSWQLILTDDSFETQPVLEELGSKEAYVDIFVERIVDTAREGDSFAMTPLMASHDFPSGDQCSGVFTTDIKQF